MFTASFNIYVFRLATNLLKSISFFLFFLFSFFFFNTHTVELDRNLLTLYLMPLLVLALSRVYATSTYRMDSRLAISRVSRQYSYPDAIKY